MSVVSDQRKGPEKTLRRTTNNSGDDQHQWNHVSQSHFILRWDFWHRFLVSGKLCELIYRSLRKCKLELFGVPPLQRVQPDSPSESRRQWLDLCGDICGEDRATHTGCSTCLNEAQTEEKTSGCLTLWSVSHHIPNSWRASSDPGRTTQVWSSGWKLSDCGQTQY